MEVNADNSHKLAIAALIVAGGVMALIFGGKIISSIMEALNLKDSKEEKEDKKTIEKASEEVTASDSPWRGIAYIKMIGTKYGKDKAAAKLIATDRMREIIEGIRKSVSSFGDNPDKLVSSFGLVTSKFQLAQVAHTFAKQYQKDLFSYLKSNFYNTAGQKDAIARIIKSMDKLPQI